MFSVSLGVSASKEALGSKLFNMSMRGSPQHPLLILLEGFMGAACTQGMGIQDVRELLDHAAKLPAARHAARLHFVTAHMSQGAFSDWLLARGVAGSKVASIPSYLQTLMRSEGKDIVEVQSQLFFARARLLLQPVSLESMHSSDKRRTKLWCKLTTVAGRRPASQGIAAFQACMSHAAQPSHVIRRSSLTLKHSSLARQWLCVCRWCKAASGSGCT